MIAPLRLALLPALLLGGDAISVARGEDRESPSKERDSLSRLMLDCDAVLIGEPIDVPRKKGNYSLTKVKVTEIIASVWPAKEDKDRVMLEKISKVIASIWPAKEDRDPMMFEKEVDTVVLADDLPATRRNAILLIGGEYILWLKSKPLSQEDSGNLGVKTSVCYEVMGGRKGAIHISDPRKLWGYARTKELLGEENPYAWQRRHLERTLKISDPADLLLATRKFAALMRVGTEGDDALRELAAAKEYIYSSTAADLLKTDRTRRLRFADRASPAQEGPATDGGEADPGRK